MALDVPMHRDGTTNIWEAVKKGSIPAVKYFCSTNPYNIIKTHLTGRDYTALHYASEAGHYNIAGFLLNQGACVDALDSEQITPLMKASQHGHHAIVKLLLNRGAQINQQDRFKRTPLHCAVANNHFSIVEELIERGANNLIRNQNNQTPLTWAITCFDELNRNKIIIYLSNFEFTNAKIE